MNELVNYTPLVRAMVRRFMGPGLEKEDLEQEAWLALHIAQRDYRPHLGVSRAAYYKVRARVALADVLRRYRRDALFWRSSSPMDFERLPDFEQQDGTSHLLAGLSRRQQQVMQMYYGEDKPLKEIALGLGLSVSAVHTYKQRGLEALRRLSCSKKGSLLPPNKVKGGDRFACGQNCS